MNKPYRPIQVPVTEIPKWMNNALKIYCKHPVSVIASLMLLSIGSISAILAPSLLTPVIGAISAHLFCTFWIHIAGAHDGARKPILAIIKSQIFRSSLLWTVAIFILVSLFSTFIVQNLGVRGAGTTHSGSSTWTLFMIPAIIWVLAWFVANLFSNKIFDLVSLAHVNDSDYEISRISQESYQYNLLALGIITFSLLLMTLAAISGLATLIPILLLSLPLFPLTLNAGFRSIALGEVYSTH